MRHRGEATLRSRGGSKGTQSASRRGAVACAYVAAALILGGGGSPAPTNEIIVQLCFAAAATVWIWLPADGGAHARVPRRLLWLGLAILALPLMQLVPLPPDVWQALPGRNLETRALALIGDEASWRPLSISAPATLAAFLSMVPAVGAMWGAASLDQHDRRALLLTIAAVTLAGALLGVLQLAGGPDSFQVYEKSHRGWLTAFHANRNAAADALLIGSLALSAWVATAPVGHDAARQRGLFAALLLGLLSLAVMLTGSRTGIALLLPVMAANGWLLAGGRRARLSRKTLGYAALLAIAALAAGLALFDNTRLAAALARFDLAGDARIALWHDAVTAMQAWFPAGSGLGTFVNAFLPFEQVAALDPFFPNRAHNDYLEFLIEAGALGLLYLAAGAAVLGSLAWQGWRGGDPSRGMPIFANGTLLIIALHAVVDYPLRNMAIACLAGVAAGWLGAARGSRGSQRNTERSGWAAGRTA